MVITIRYHLHASMTDAGYPRLSVGINFLPVSEYTLIDPSSIATDAKRLDMQIDRAGEGN